MVSKISFRELDKFQRLSAGSPGVFSLALAPAADWRGIASEGPALWAGMCPGPIRATSGRGQCLPCGNGQLQHRGLVVEPILVAAATTPMRRRCSPSAKESRAPARLCSWSMRKQSLPAGKDHNHHTSRAAANKRHPVRSEISQSRRSVG
jgi:hypothetical protein